MRVSSETMVAQTLNRLQSRLASFDRAQNQLASGKNFLNSSEDVSGMNTSLALRSERRSVEQASRNAEDAMTRINLADSKLQSMLSTMRRARDLAIRGASTLQPSERNAIAEEITSIRDEMVELSNSSFLGHGLFAGTAAGDAVADVAGTWTYTGDSGTLQRRISTTETISVNLLGSEVLGFDAGESAFDVLDQLAADVTAGDTSAVASGLDAIDRVTGRIETGLARLGAAGNRIETALGRNLEIDETLQRQISQVEDVDLAEAIMKVNTEEVALQTTLGAIGRALQPSLLNYLR
ncbi:MAG: flagellin [Acidimicrobiales bacterium]|nr:hypothetical protein [Acidimicrobiales bacterium]